MSHKPTKDQIAECRQKILEAYEANKDLYYEADINRIRSEDVLVERYLSREMCDVDSAVEIATGGLRFTKRQKIPEIKESEFSPELHSIPQYQGVDKKGNRTVFLRYKVAKKILKRNSKDQEKLKRLALYYFKKIEDETKGMATIVVDARSLAIRDLVKYANKDLAAVGAWLLTSVVRYSPDQIGQIYIYEMPRFFSAIVERILKLAPDQYQGRVKLVRKKDIDKYIAKDELPDYMGGKKASSGAAKEDEEGSGEEDNEVKTLEEMERALEVEDTQM